MTHHASGKCVGSSRLAQLLWPTEPLGLAKYGGRAGRVMFSQMQLINVKLLSESNAFNVTSQYSGFARERPSKS